MRYGDCSFVEKTLFADVWSFGCVMFAIASGVSVWEGFSEFEIVGSLGANPIRLPDISSLKNRARDLCRRCFVEDPRKRPAMNYIAKELLAWPLLA